MTEQYRKNVGIILLNSQNQVLMFERADQTNTTWQFPQGGIEEGEDIISAAYRELYEETGIKSVQFVHQMPYNVKYKFNRVLNYGSSDYVGQEQTWVLFEFTGSESEIKFDCNPQEIEFRSFKWFELSQAPELIVPFKKAAYQTVVNYFSDYIKDYCHEY